MATVLYNNLEAAAYPRLYGLKINTFFREREVREKRKIEKERERDKRTERRTMSKKYIQEGRKIKKRKERYRKYLIGRERERK